MHTRQSLFNVPFGFIRSRANACLCIAAMVAMAAVLSLTASGARGAGRGIGFDFCPQTGVPASTFPGLRCEGGQDHLFDYAAAYSNAGANFSKCAYMRDYPATGRGTPRICMGGDSDAVTRPGIFPNDRYDYHAFIFNNDCCTVRNLGGFASY